LGLTGEEVFAIQGIADALAVGKKLGVVATPPQGAPIRFEVRARIDTLGELDYYRHGGILPYVVRSLSREA
jgi:aconitate hydratase